MSSALGDRLRRRLQRTAWYADGLAFECAGCGRCCSGAPGYVWVDVEDCERLAGALGIGRDRFVEEYTEPARGRRTLRERPGGDCVLLDSETRACRVYEVRPVQCRTWPWWKENLSGAARWERAARDCPGIGRGRVHSASHILEQMKADRAANG
jgi:uncharacterized protein